MKLILIAGQMMVAGRVRPLGIEAVPGRSKTMPHLKPASRLAAKRSKPAQRHSPDPGEQLRIDLRRWSLCRTFVHQFGLIAKPVPKTSSVKVSKRKKRGQGRRGLWRGYKFKSSKRLRPTPQYDNELEGNSEMAALLAYYGAKIEVTRRSLPAREVGAAVRALREEQKAAVRALTERQQQARHARRLLATGPERPEDESISNNASLVA